MSDECSSTQITSKKSFRINAKYWALTYPQCSLPNSAALIALKDIAKERLHWCLVGEEKHADGQPHLHAIVALHTRWNVRNPHHWDLHGYHGNYQAVKSLQKWIIYVTKEKNVVSHGADWEQMRAQALKKQSTKDRDWETM